jgi:hypothetical protein
VREEQNERRRGGRELESRIKRIIDGGMRLTGHDTRGMGWDGMGGDGEHRWV